MDAQHIGFRCCSVSCEDPPGGQGDMVAYRVLPACLPDPAWSPSACAEILAMKNKERIDGLGIVHC